MASWDWYWKSDYQRENMLRTQLDDLSANAYLAQSRLSSQLARLQGSLESRLAALSAAFDAYVELGDIREQLASSPDTAMVRRDAGTVLQDLRAGLTPEPVDPRGLDYWLPYAVNAVAKLASGVDATAEEQQAEALSQRTPFFVVAALGMLGRGETVAGRVPELLTCDDVLNPAQVALWRAVVADVYPGVVNEVRTTWFPALAQPRVVPDALDWAARQARADHVPDARSWLQVEVSALAGEQPTAVDANAEAHGDQRPPADGTPPDPFSPAVARAQLERIVTSLVAEGMGEEVTLLARAHQLRERIERPTSASAPTSMGGAPAAANGTAVVQAVRDAFGASAPGSARRAVLRRWLVEDLRAALTGLEETARRPVGATRIVRTPGGEVEVRPDGADPRRREQVEANVVALSRDDPKQLTVSATMAGVLAVLAVVSAATGHPRLGIFLLVLTVVAVVVAGLAWRDRARGRRQGEADLATVRSDLAEAVADVAREVNQRRQAQDETSRDLARLRSVLDGAVNGAGNRAVNGAADGAREPVGPVGAPPASSAR